MIRIAAALCMLAAPALACERVAALLEGGQGALTQGAMCRATITLDIGPELVCFWEHELRSPQATAQFNALLAEVGACLGRAPVQGGVNHPDTYLLHQFGPAAEISLSLKDKGALGQTLVVLRVTQP